MAVMQLDDLIIEHLDFETEEPPTCTLKIRRGTDHRECGRLAEWVVTCAKPCGHIGDTYLCNSCYERAVINAVPPYTWRCSARSAGSMCGYLYFPRDSIINAERI